MTNLEWINGKIEIFNRKIKLLNSKLNRKHTGITDPLGFDLTTEEIQTALSQITQVLQVLQQIKVELEAWEVAKKTILCFDDSLIFGIIEGLYNTSKINTEKVQSFKKALEVKND